MEYIMEYEETILSIMQWCKDNINLTIEECFVKAGEYIELYNKKLNSGTAEEALDALANCFIYSCAIGTKSLTKMLFILPQIKDIAWTSKITPFDLDIIIAHAMVKKRNEAKK